jgi:hypothetical protein
MKISLPRGPDMFHIQLKALFAVCPFQDSNRGNMIYRDRKCVRGSGSGPWFTPVQDHVLISGFWILIFDASCFLLSDPI